MNSRIFEPSDMPWVLKRLVRKSVLSIPPVSWHLRMAGLRGWAHGRFSQVPAHVRSNIEDVFSELLEPSELDEVVRRHHEMSKRLYLPWILPQHPRSEDPSLWPVRGREFLDEALQDGRGVILLTAHLGYIRMISFILRVHGYQVMQVAAGGPARNASQEKREERLAEASRLRQYIYHRTRVTTDLVQPYHIQANLNVRPIFDALKANHPILVPGDGMRAAEFVELPLLGRSYPFATGYMKIAMMTGATVLPTFGVDEERGNRIVVQIRPRLGIDPDRSVVENLRLYASALGAQLERTPHLWHRWSAGEDCFEQALQWSRRDLRQRYDSGSGTRLRWEDGVR